jgi:TonB-linked SusC/RagA family outer membrane protein
MEKIYKRKIRKINYCLKAMLFCAIFSASFVRAEGVQRDGFKTERLDSYLKKIELAYQVSFVYDATQINKAMPIDVPAKLVSINSDLIPLRAKGIDYSIVGVQVILKKVPEPPVVRQDILVKGRVRNAKDANDFIPGVNVRGKGTSNGSATNGNGEYQIRVQKGATLVFTSIGYKAFETAVNGRATIDVALQEDENTLQEVTISTGYQTIDKKLFTGAATSIKGSEVKQDGVVDVSRMLEGKVAGVSVQNVSGTFGSAPKIRVRGATSISGENKPLWVIDGVILEDVVNISNDQLSSGDASTLIGSSVAGINADDIESFNILKDASATALYGARAMNGVVVITTKKGRVGKPVVSYNGNYSTFLKPTYDTYNIMNSADQMSVYSEIARKGGLGIGISNSSDGGVYTRMWQQIKAFDESTGKFGLINTPEARAAYLQRYVTANTDWFDILFKNSLVQEHSISVSSGTDKATHYFSGGFYNDNGWSIADKVKRYTLNMRNDYTLSDKFTLGLLATGALRQQDAPGTLGRTSNVVEGKYTRSFDINPFSYALNTSRSLTAYDENGNFEYFPKNYAPFNVIEEQENNSIKLDMLDMKLQAELGYKILKNLNFKSIGALRYVKTTREHRITEYSNMANAYRYAPTNVIRQDNPFLYKDPAYPDVVDKQIVLPQGGFYNRSDDNLINFYVRNQLDWKQEIGSKHIVSALAGQEVKFSNRKNSYNNGYGYQYDKGGVPFIDYRIIKQMLEGNFNYYGMTELYDRYASFFINGSYSYAGKYIFSATGRYDGSNRLGSSPVARWLPTWTTSAAWNVDEENFVKKISQISYLKVRGGYGLTASMGSATNSSIVLNNSSTLRPILSDVEPRIVLSELENSELTWEKQYEANIGLDLGLFGDRFNFAFDYYNRKGFDLISSMRTSGIGGQITKQANYADMNSHGYEATLGGRILKTDALTWRANLTFGYNKNKIVNLKSRPRIYDLIIPEGGPREFGAVRGLYSINFQALDKLGIPTFIDETGENSNGVYVQSANTDYLIYEGTIDPIVTGGLTNNFNYKGFNLRVFVSYQAGNKIRLNNIFSSSYSDDDALPREFLDRWTLPLDQNATNVPSIADYLTRRDISGIYPYTAYNYSSERVADGSFVRLKEVSLAYNLPSKWIKSIGGSNLSLTLIGNNIWLIYADKKLKGQDPEFFSSGGVAMPVPKQITASLKVGF